MVELIDAGKSLPVDLRGRVIYYVGPVRAVRNEVVGPAGPTTSSRLDDFTDKVLAETGLFAMVGKAERGPAAIASIVRHKTPYLAAVGGAAYLIS
ncbi:fumarate hydratase, partial [bacterium M00.F.Ca.ET.194.01.1.1]